MQTISRLNSRNVKLLHLAGSVQSEFLHDLSFMYCKAAWNVLTPSYPNSWLVALTPEKKWYITDKFMENKDIVSLPSYEQNDAILKLKDIGFDAVVPHMFCTPGMTTYRKIMQDANFALMGSPSNVCEIADNKQKTKEILNKHNVRVPQGKFITQISKAPETFPFPCIVKPCDLDNSVGVRFCTNQEEYKLALDYNFSISKQILIEEYIAGEEIRVGVIETKDGELQALPMLKYLLDGSPIRGMNKKLNVDDQNVIQGFATTPEMMELPAIVDEKMKEKMVDAAKKAHRALGCELYSLFDFRVNEKEAVILEACLFCSFGPASIMNKMAAADNIECLEFFDRMLEVRLNRKTNLKEA